MNTTPALRSIPLAQNPLETVLLDRHPYNRDPTACLYLADHRRGDVYRVQGRYVAVLPGSALHIEAIVSLFDTVADALAAIDTIMQARQARAA
jgi:hypothetical protein